MSVRAKFKVVSITATEGYSGKGPMKSVKLHPVTYGSDENEKFYAATPCGQIEIGILSEDAAKQFEVGKQYFVDFSAAE